MQEMKLFKEHWNSNFEKTRSTTWTLKENGNWHYNKGKRCTKAGTTANMNDQVGRNS